MNVLIIDQFPDPWRSRLQDLPVEVNYVPKADRAVALALLPEADVLIMNSKIKVDQEAIDIAVRLKLIVRAGIGMDHIDTEYLKEKGIRAENTIGANADSVGEQTVGMLLALRHKLMTANQEVKNFFWRREANRAAEIGGKTIGLVGYGHTGQAVARRLRGFGMKVLAYDKYKSGFGDEWVTEATMEDIYEQAEMVSLHIPLTDETREMCNDAFFDRFHHPITFLNLARGPIVNMTALLRAMDDHQVVAVAIDVLPNEKFDTLTMREKKTYESLFARKNVIVSPHIGGWSHESLDNINSRIIGFVKDLVEEPTGSDA